MHPQKIFILEKILTNALEHPNSGAAKDKKGRKAVERLPDIKRNDSLSLLPGVLKAVEVTPQFHHRYVASAITPSVRCKKGMEDNMAYWINFP